MTLYLKYGGSYLSFFLPFRKKYLQFSGFSHLKYTEYFTGIPFHSQQHLRFYSHVGLQILEEPSLEKDYLNCWQ